MELLLSANGSHDIVRQLTTATKEALITFRRKKYFRRKIADAKKRGKWMDLLSVWRLIDMVSSPDGNLRLALGPTSDADDSSRPNSEFVDNSNFEDQLTFAFMKLSTETDLEGSS